MVKRILLIVLIIAPITLFAQEKYAFVNYQEIMSKMPELSDMETKLVAKREAIRKNVESLETEYQQKLKVFQEDTVNITQSIMQTRYMELEQMEERYRQFVENSNNEMQQEQQTLLVPIQQKLQKAVQDVGNEQSYTYIFDTNTLIYKSTKLIDATKLVTAKLGIAN